MRFSEIPGQKVLKNNLIDSFKRSKVAHAQLFRGSPGGPNLAMALAFATYLNCENKGDDSCGTCPSCSKSDKLVHPDIHFSFPVTSTDKFKTEKDLISQNFLPKWRPSVLANPYMELGQWLNELGADNKQGNISKQESRQIIKALSLKAFEAEFKIMLIWLPEMMHIAAANALLKILEEPPEKTVFLMVSNDADNLLNTILSRVQVRGVKHFGEEELSHLLVNQKEIDEKLAHQLAHIAGGDFNKAVSLAEEVEDESHPVFRDWMRNCYKKDHIALVKKSEEFQAMNKVLQKNLFGYGLSILRESLLALSKSEKLRKLRKEELEFVDRFSHTIDAGKIQSLYSIFGDAIFHLERNANAKILFLDVSLKTSEILREG